MLTYARQIRGEKMAVEFTGKFLIGFCKFNDVRLILVIDWV